MLTRQRQGDLPVKPERPLPADCCESGCDKCVFTDYEEALLRWEAEMKQLLAFAPPQAGNDS